jgi:hypothetical protein
VKNYPDWFEHIVKKLYKYVDTLYIEAWKYDINNAVDSSSNLENIKFPLMELITEESIKLINVHTYSRLKKEMNKLHTLLSLRITTHDDYITTREKIKKQSRSYQYRQPDWPDRYVVGAVFRICDAAADYSEHYNVEEAIAEALVCAIDISEDGKREERIIKCKYFMKKIVQLIKDNN